MTDLLRVPRAVVRRVCAGCRAFGRAMAATEYSCPSFSQYGGGYVLSGRSPSALYFLDAKSSGYDGSPFLNPA
jgi:hypothetical protein